GRPLRRPRRPGRAVDDRQRLRLPRHHPRARLQSARDQTPAHPPLPAANQPESGALHPHPARRLGLRRDLPRQRRPTPRTRRLARLLQSTTTTPQPRPPSPTRAPTDAQPEQRPRVLQLAGERVPSGGGELVEFVVAEQGEVEPTAAFARAL